MFFSELHVGLGGKRLARILKKTHEAVFFSSFNLCLGLLCIAKGMACEICRGVNSLKRGQKHAFSALLFTQSVHICQTNNKHTYRQTDRQTYGQSNLHTFVYGIIMESSVTALAMILYSKQLLKSFHLYVGANCGATCLISVMAWHSLLFTSANYSFGYNSIREYFQTIFGVLNVRL